jgi:lipoyl(octanoyl) transferase
MTRDHPRREPVDDAAVEWRIANGLVSYPDAVAFMEARVADIAHGRARELIWLVEHPPIYTAGTSARSTGLLAADRFPVYETGRGGAYTYHGPGQRVVYVMLDLRTRARGDVRRFVGLLEQWTIEALRAFSVTGEVREGRVGVWVRRPTRAARADGTTAEDKIAALGIRVRHGISFHGLSINVEPDLSHFDGIVPCGLANFGVTSLVDLGLPVTMADVDLALRLAFERVIAPIVPGITSGYDI